MIELDGSLDSSDLQNESADVWGSDDADCSDDDDVVVVVVVFCDDDEDVEGGGFGSGDCECLFRVF